MSNPLFVKPKGVRYVDMCIWIDNNFYEPDCDNNKAFSYMYLLALMLAGKNRYFNTEEDYDGYANLLAQATYNRMRDLNKPRIKSVLNYMKSIMFFRKMAYQSESFNEVINPEYNKSWNSDLYHEKLISEYQSNNINNLFIDVSDVLKNLPELVKCNMPKIYNEKSEVYHNIYISVLLSLLSSFTLPKVNADFLEEKLKSTSQFNVVTYYRKHLTEDIILWRLGEDKHDLVKVISNAVKSDIIKDIRDLIADYTVDDSMFDMITTDILFGDEKREDN